MSRTNIFLKSPREQRVPLPRFYLIECRKKAGYSVEEVSRRLDISHYYYYQIESGKRGIKLPIQLALNLIKVMDLDPIKFLESETEHARMYADINRDT